MLIQLVYILNFLLFTLILGQSVSFSTYINPVIPGDHPDPTLTKVGNDFYTSGSSFNPTPKIYHSTDLVHWEVIAQPVSCSWSEYGDEPGGGIWGGHTVYYNNSYWHYFARGGKGMFFVKADDPHGPWSEPVALNTSPGLPPFGQDNSIFIDEATGKWYLLTKAGQQNNHIVELGMDGQPTGVVLDLTWLNPNSEGNPYGWAEGPVMWKYKGYYYYSFAEHLVGKQYVMRSDSLSDEESSWKIFGENIFTGSPTSFNTPNHISPVVMLDDSTSWTIAHSNHVNSNWYAQGRQGLLCQVTYNDSGFPVIHYPPVTAAPAPDLPSSGIPWMVPKSDTFDGPELDPKWSHLGFTPGYTYGLDIQEGWLYLEPYGGSNTLIQNDGEHNYSLITRVDFEPKAEDDEAGLWIVNGPETQSVQVFSSVNAEGHDVLAFSQGGTEYEVENTIGSIVWLKLVRNEHVFSGFYSADGNVWNQIGNAISSTALDIQQTEYNDFTGNQQGPYVKGNYAFFDMYIYRDAYTPIIARSPANMFGTSEVSGRNFPPSLGSINDGDWALFAGVEFGNADYQKFPDSLEIPAACATEGGVIEVWLDSIDTGEKIAECPVVNSGGWTNYIMYRTNVDSVAGQHDVYLKFTGSGTDELFRIKWFRFLSKYDVATSIEEGSERSTSVEKFQLYQNYPNPFNATTEIKYSVLRKSHIILKIYNLLGEEVMSVFEGLRQPGEYTATIDGTNLASGVYLYKLKDDKFEEVKKFILLK